MPSLRRTVSESAGTARTSPYPTGLSLSAAGALNAGIPNRPRRTGSETSGRRVLADIEWWRILDGQQEEENENGDENGQDRVAELQPGLVDAVQEPVNEQIATAAMMNTDDDDAAVSSPDASQGASSLTTPFAAMSISSVAPMTPPRSRSVSESSDSSVESTPESSPRTPALQHDTLFMDAPAFDCTSADAEFCTLLPPFLGVRPSVLNAMSMMRSVSFGGFDAPRESADERFGDVIFI